MANSDDDTNFPGATSRDDVIDLRALVPRLWRGKYYVLVTMIVLFFVGLAYVRTIVPRYTAALSVAAASMSPRGGAASAAVGAFASLAGFGASNNVTPFDLYIASLGSNSVAAQLTGDQPLMHALFPAEWDPRTRTWHEPDTMTTGVRRFFIRLGVPLTPWRAPDAARLQAYLQHNIRVSRTSGSPITTIELSDSDPHRAAALLNRVSTIADERVRRADLERARQYIAYLQRELSLITQVDQRLAVIAILSDEQRTMMTASSSLSYGAETVEPAAVPESPSSLSPTVVLLLFVVAGAAVGGLLVLTRLPTTFGRFGRFGRSA